MTPDVISGVLRDFTPALNPDFAPRSDHDDRGFVANLIDTDSLPGALLSACHTCPNQVPIKISTVATKPPCTMRPCRRIAARSHSAWLLR